MSDDDVPVWRYVVPGLLFAGLAAYMLVTGEIAVDKQRSLTITRANDPALYWSSVVASGTAGLLALRKAWRRIAGS